MAPLHARPADMAQEVYEGIVVAQRLRSELGLSDLAPIDCIVELAERRLALEVVLAPLGGGVSGFYLPARPMPIVVVEESHPVQRQRFTIAHEVGHHALGHDAAPRIHGEEPAASGAAASAAGGDGTSGANVVPDAPVLTAASPPPATHHARHYTPRRAPNSDERAANAFAGELLIPHQGAKRLMPQWTGEPALDIAVRLSAHYGISAFAATVKLEVLGVLDRRTARDLRRQLAGGAHYERYDALSLAPLRDQLQRHADVGGGPRCSPGARRVLAALRAEFDALA
jgi:Zn-dependent peptidase ImmA (M78 family)